MTILMNVMINMFDALFSDGLYEKIGKNAIDCAAKIRSALRDNGYQIYIEASTNQVFVIIDNDRMQRLSEKVEFGFWGKYDENHTVIRFATSWATTGAGVNQLMMLLAE